MINIVDPEDLEDDEEYDDICEDIKTECQKFGTVLSMEVPRPQKDVEDVPIRTTSKDDRKLPRTSSGRIRWKPERLNL